MSPLSLGVNPIVVGWWAPPNPGGADHHGLAANNQYKPCIFNDIIASMELTLRRRAKCYYLLYFHTHNRLLGEIHITYLFSNICRKYNKLPLTCGSPLGIDLLHFQIYKAISHAIRISLLFSIIKSVQRHFSFSPGLFSITFRL